MHKRVLAVLTALILPVVLSCCGQSAESKLTSGFQNQSSEGNISFNYTLYSPKEGKKLPVVIYFHGFGENNAVTDTKVVSTLTWDESQAVHPCIVLAPHIEDDVYLAQTNRDKLYRGVKNIVDKMVQNGNIDPDRIYVCGNSFGGLATVEFTENQEP